LGYPNVQYFSFIFKKGQAVHRMTIGTHKTKRPWVFLKDKPSTHENSM